MKIYKRIEKIKSDIKTKFGSQARFARIIGQDPYFVQLLFANSLRRMTPGREKLLFRIEELIKITKPDTDDGKSIQQIDRDRLRDYLATNYGSESMFEKIKLFIEEHSLNITPVTIYKILDGERKRKTELFNRINKIISK
jgi:hypothetical protein